MPEEFQFEESDIPEVVPALEEWLNNLAVSERGLTVGDFDSMFQVLYFRMRSVYTTEQMHVRLHGLMAQGEHMLSTPGFLEDEDGAPTAPILRENFADTTDEDYHKMLADQYTEVSDEDINALLDQIGDTDE